MNLPKICDELPANALHSLHVREWRADETKGFLALLDLHHYLKSPDVRRRHLEQVVVYQEQPVALLTWCPAARALAGRERFIGWDARTRQKRLPYVVQNNRFLLLPRHRPPNMASRVLKLAVDHLPGAWQARHGRTPLLAETFVDPEGFRGTCYNAAGWTNAGRTAGYERVCRDYYVEHERPKDLWLKMLDRNALQRLRDPSKLLPGEKTGPAARVPGAMPVSAPIARSLRQALREVPDPRQRKGLVFPLGAMLTTTVLALCCGARTLSDIVRFCEDLRHSQRSILGFRRDRKNPKCYPPPGEGCWRDVLRRVDPSALGRALNRWQQSQCDTLPQLLSIDGKVIGNNLATLVSLVDAEDGTPVAQAAAPGNGKEQALAQELVESLPEGSLEGKTVAGDALYMNRRLVRCLVQEGGGHVLVQLKSNQPGMLTRVEDKLTQYDPPFCPRPSN